MSRVARNRAARRRIQPYAWLGVGAVTVGMGAAMVGGTAVATADTGADASVSNSVDAADAGSAPAKSTAPNRRAARVARAAAAVADTAAPARTGRGSALKPNLPAAVKAKSASPALRGRAAAIARAEAAIAPASDPAPVLPAASVAAAAVDPAPGMDSWLPGGTNPGEQIVPGEKVKLALVQIVQARDLLRDETWGAGNVLAGLGSFGPLAALSTSQLMLTLWGSSIASAQERVASTVGNPVLHSFAQANLQNELTYTKLSNIALATASALIPTLSWVGADVTGSEALVNQAQENGKVYAKVPVSIKAGTEPVAKARINGGPRATLLVDTGASGLVTTRDKVGSSSLGTPTGWGDSCFSGGLCYHYETYNTTVDLGDGAIATVPVNIVTDNEEYPDSVQTFKDFFSWGADGILGVGANTAGPGPAPIPTAGMPGELADGVLIYQNAYPFGLGGYMILGPNLFPTRVSLTGAPDAFVKVKVNGGALQDGAAIIDSGGVYGTLNRDLYPGADPLATDVPAGTTIDVYAPDGTTLLYSYTTQGSDSATEFIDEGLFNTGNAPYAQNPIYLNYGATPYGIGSTEFSIA